MIRSLMGGIGERRGVVRRVLDASLA